MDGSAGWGFWFFGITVVIAIVVIGAPYAVPVLDRWIAWLEGENQRTRRDREP